MEPAQVEAFVRAALAEDLGEAGDITTKPIARVDQPLRAVILAKSPGVLAGIIPAEEAFLQIDRSTRATWKKVDGQSFLAGDEIARISGRARAILAAERVALNLLQQLSGVATSTKRFVEVCEPHGVKVLCTRKTVPGMRALQRYAVDAAGGDLHRAGLFDAVLIKTNHVKLCGGITEAVKRCRATTREPIEVECTTIAEVEEALDAKAEKILLDNASLPDIAKAVEVTRGKASLEVSGGIDLDAARQIAPLGPDAISVGALTHSAQAIDLALRIVR